MDEENESIWGSLSLVQKSILVGTVLLIINSLALTITFSNIQEKYQLKALEDEGEATARSLVEVCKYGLITKNLELLDSQLQGMATKNVGRIELLDKDGNKLANAFGNELLMFDYSNLKKRALTSSTVQRENVNGDKGDPFAIVIAYPIELQKKSMREEIGVINTGGEKERIGTVIVSMNAGQVYRELANNKKTFFILATILIVVGIGVIVFFVQFTAKPLKKLVMATQKVSEGDLEYRAEVTSGDEIGELARSFNSMVEKLKQTQERLIMSERLAAAGRLAADVAHEINNPLAIMKNYIYILLNKRLGPDDPARQTVSIMDSEIDRIARIIGQFNDFYMSSHLPLEEVDINEPLNEVITLCREAYDGNGVKCEIKLSDGCNALGNRDKLKQVFLNLMKNAVEAMPDGGLLIIETGKKDDKIIVSMTDTGSGISRDHINRVFDPFFSTKGIKGVGLGLAVSYGIIKSLNGHIEVESQIGIGSIFRVTLQAV